MMHSQLLPCQYQETLSRIDLYLLCKTTDATWKACKQYHLGFRICLVICVCTCIILPHHQVSPVKNVHCCGKSAILQDRGLPQEPVTEVVDVARDAPPAGHDELCAAARLQSLQLLHPWMLGIPPEQVLLVVGRPENEVTQRIQ